MNDASAKHRQLLRHRLIGCAIGVLLGIWGLGRLSDFQHFKSLAAWSMITGYLAIVLIALTLVIGPLKMWLPAAWQRALTLLRRDLGILAGLAAIGHVAMVLVMFDRGNGIFLIGEEYRIGRWTDLFVVTTPEGFTFLKLDKTGIANWMGAFAFLALMGLWITSSNRAERWLGPSWKRLHLANLMIFVLVSFHAVIYVTAVKGSPHQPADIFWITAAVLLVRWAAFFTTLARRKR